MAEQEPLVAKKDVQVIDVHGVPRMIFAGYQVPADLREAYEAAIKPKSKKKS